MNGLNVPETVKLAVEEIHRAPYNPRVMTPDKMKALKASLKKHGFVLNLVVQKWSKELNLAHVLIGGHQRVTAMEEICKEEGWPLPTHLPCIVLDVKDDIAKQLNISLNNVEGEFDPFKLGQIFTDIYPTMTTDDVLASGFIQEQIEQMQSLVLSVDDQLASLQKELDMNMPDFGRSITLSIEFDTVEARDETKAILKRLAMESNSKPGDIVTKAIVMLSSLHPA